MKKTFIIDTNVLLYDPLSIFAFEDNDVVIPFVVLEEIDKQKSSRFDNVGHNARMSNRLLDELRQKGDITQGVALPGGGTLCIVKNDYNAHEMPGELDKNKVDNVIISCAIDMKARLETPVMLITKDISMRIKCDVLHVPCDDYLKHRVAGKSDLVYGGVRVINTSKNVIDQFYATRRLLPSYLDIEDKLMPNEYIVLKNGGSASGLARYVEGELRPIITCDEIWGLKPKSKEQKFALDALLDDDIKLATLLGPAGGGKTLLAVAAGLIQVLESRKYKKLIVSRPIQPMGNDIGYLPGTKEEKMLPWIQPIIDNLEHLFGAQKNRDLMQMYFDNRTIEVEAITYIRGRSIPNAYIIIDEAQNLSVREVKTIITRAGENSKIVLTGDITQIDNDQIDSVSNGLTYVVEKFKSYDVSAHITLKKGERSKLATIAADIL